MVRELEYDLEEIEYSRSDEMQVIEEIRIGLMMGEIRTTITKEELKNWFADIQIKRKDWASWCENITCQDLIQIARECGLKVI